MEGIISGVSYDTKTVRFEDGQAETSVPLVMTALDGKGNDILEDAGFGGRYVIFHLVDGSVDEAFADPYTIDHWAVGPQLTEFMLEVRRGWQAYGKDGIDWTEVEDGSVVTPDEFGIAENPGE